MIAVAITKRISLIHIFWKGCRFRPAAFPFEGMKMKIEKNISAMTMMILKYIADIVVDEGEPPTPTRILELRIGACSSLIGIMRQYASYGFPMSILETICEKKFGFIKAATTKSDIDEILYPSVPGYNGNTFSPRSAFHIEEEELLLWAYTSLRGPLISDAARRYEELVRKYLPKQYKMAFGKYPNV